MMLSVEEHIPCVSEEPTKLSPHSGCSALAAQCHCLPSITTMSSSPASRLSLLHLYRRLLRSAQMYPSMKRLEIFQAIREDFRDNAASLSPDDEKTKQQIAIAYQGLSQLQQFDQVKMSGGGGAWNVNLTQNPMPRTPLPEQEK